MGILAIVNITFALIGIFAGFKIDDSFGEARRTWKLTAIISILISVIGLAIMLANIFSGVDPEFLTDLLFKF